MATQDSVGSWGTDTGQLVHAEERFDFVLDDQGGGQKQAIRRRRIDNE